jgi:hypothetical protein
MTRATLCVRYPITAEPGLKPAGPRLPWASQIMVKRTLTRWPGILGMPSGPLIRHGAWRLVCHASTLGTSPDVAELIMHEARPAGTGEFAGGRRGTHAIPVARGRPRHGLDDGHAGGLAGTGGGQRPGRRRARLAGAHRIQHVIEIMLENHTHANLFPVHVRRRHGRVRTMKADSIRVEPAQLTLGNQARFVASRAGGPSLRSENRQVSAGLSGPSTCRHGPRGTAGPSPPSCRRTAAPPAAAQRHATRTIGTA